jgi:hypothetical protein
MTRIVSENKQKNFIIFVDQHIVIYFTLTNYFHLLKQDLTKVVFIIKENIDQNFLVEQMTHLY